jgi:hypothetical protein
MNALVIVSAYFRSFPDWLFSRSGFQTVLVLAAIGALLAFVQSMPRALPPGSPYFSGRFFLALSPFVFMSLLSLSEWRYSVVSYEYDRNRMTVAVFCFLWGAGLSAALLFLYSAARRRANVSPQ